MQSNAAGYCALHAPGIELKNVSGTIVYGMIGWQNGTLVGPHVVLIARAANCRSGGACRISARFFETT
jgi:hypothetical protein